MVATQTVKVYEQFGKESRNVAVDDVRVRFMFDYDADLSYIERFDSAEEYNAWCEREGTLNARERFISMRRETRQYDGMRFEPFYVEKQYPRQYGEGGVVVEWQTIKRWLPVGEYYPIRFTTKRSYDASDLRHGIVRLAHKSEIHQGYDEYCRGWGDLNNYESFGAILETRCGCCGEWNESDSIWGIDFYTGPGSQYPHDKTPEPDHAYSLAELATEPFRWVASDHFGIDFETLTGA